jgi:hypothetical protein
MHADRLCRDEDCDQLGLHEEHTIKPLRRRASMPATYSEDDPPWRRPAKKALDHSIAKAVLQTYPKPFEVIMRDVEYDYGSCNMRTVQRRLRALVQRGHLLQINLGKRIYAYVRPGSNMLNDHALMREQIESLATVQ